MLVVLALVCHLVAFSSAQCPRGCACIRGTRIRCSLSSLTEVPNFDSSIRQTATEVELGSNLITSIDANDFQGFIRLETLDLNGNSISSIEPGSFSSNTALENLDLSNNMLREIPDNLFQSTTLFSLNLANNDIMNISASTFTGVQTDGTINLDGNVIRTIPEGTFDSTGRLDELTLSRNPLRCDCQLRWFPSYRTSIRAQRNLGTCSVPPSLSGTNLQVLTEDQLTCDCIPACVNGTCNMTVGMCECNNGFIGGTCDTPCPAGMFGERCSRQCTCLPGRESSPCNGVDGSCHCLPGYTGSSCEQECPDGFFGQDCLDVCTCQNNASCHFITGMCNCTIGFTGATCSMICPPTRYGLGCSETCICQTGNCHHITGDCGCPIGFFGPTCGHNCTEATNCGGIGRMECSLQTPEQTCGPCLPGYVGQRGNSNSECIMCSGAPDCTSLNRVPCSTVANTCGQCFRRHLTTPPGNEGIGNALCFDPCIDGIRNHGETDIDCGGPLCPPCSLNQMCTGPMDCATRSVCLGFYTHPSRLDFPFMVQANNTCVAEDDPGNAILERFRSALRNRENPLPDISQNPLFTRDILEASVEREMREQFNIPQRLESIRISDLNQAPGDPLYQTDIKLSQEGAEESFDQMIENIHNGKLLGTTLFNRKDRKALCNF